MKCAAIALLVVSVLLPAASRADENELKPVDLLPCTQPCGTWVPPKRLEYAVHFPMAERRVGDKTATEGYVLVRFTVTAEGRVANPVVERLIGPQDFADALLAKMEKWSYQPATLDGKPIQSDNNFQVVTFRLSNLIGARVAVKKPYDAAFELMKQKKFADAIVLLKPVLQLEYLSLYERSMTSFALAANYMALGDNDDALWNIRDATLASGGMLPVQAWEDAVRMRIRLEALADQYADALAWFDFLKANRHLAADDGDALLMADLRTFLADPKPIPISAMVPVGREQTSWAHTLLRRAFSFSGIEGSLDHFDLRCDQREVTMPITAGTQWRAPADARNCTLLVYGSPGTKFKVTETVN